MTASDTLVVVPAYNEAGAVGDVVMGTPEFGLPPANGSTLFNDVKPLLKGDVLFGNLEEALAHIARHGSRHTDAICTRNASTATGPRSDRIGVPSAKQAI